MSCSDNSDFLRGRAACIIENVRLYVLVLQVVMAFAVIKLILVQSDLFLSFMYFMMQMTD